MIDPPPHAHLKTDPTSTLLFTSSFNTLTPTPSPPPPPPCSHLLPHPLQGDEYAFRDSQQYLEATLFGTMSEDVAKAYNPMICCSNVFDVKIRVAMMQGGGNAPPGSHGSSHHPLHSHSHGQGHGHSHHNYQQQPYPGQGLGPGQGMNRGSVPPPSVYGPTTTTTPATTASTASSVSTGLSGRNSNIGGGAGGGTTGRAHNPHAPGSGLAQLELKTKPSRNTANR